MKATREIETLVSDTEYPVVHLGRDDSHEKHEDADHRCRCCHIAASRCGRFR